MTFLKKAIAIYLALLAFRRAPPHDVWRRSVLPKSPRTPFSGSGKPKSALKKGTSARAPKGPPTLVHWLPEPHAPASFSGPPPASPLRRRHRYRCHCRCQCQVTSGGFDGRQTSISETDADSTTVTNPNAPAGASIIHTRPIIPGSFLQALGFLQVLQRLIVV